MSRMYIARIFAIVAVSIGVCLEIQAQPVVSFSASPTTIALGQSSTLTWNVTNSTSVVIGGVGPVGPSGTQSVFPTQTTTYVLQATGPGGTAQNQATVTVSAQTVISLFSASPTVVNEGDSSTLTWSVQNATGVTIDNGIGAVSSSGSMQVKALQTTTYTLTATGSTMATATTTVSVTPPPLPLQVSIRAVPNAVQAGQPVTLVWSTTGATNATLDGASVELNASKNVSPVQTTTYRLAAANGSQTANASATVTVTTVPSPQISTFNATPSSGNAGQAVTLSWSTTGATSVTIDNGVGSVGTSGNTTVTPAGTTIYSLTAVGAGGSSTKTAQVMINIHPPTVVTTLGTPGATGSTDGSAAVLFNQPAAIGLDASGNIYVVDSGNHTIRKIDPSGLTVTWVGQAGKPDFRDGFRNAARFNFTGFSGGMLVLPGGSMLVRDASNRRRNVDLQGNVTTSSGASGAGLVIIGIATDSALNTYEAESGNNRILKTAKGQTTAVPFAGNVAAGSADGQGTAASFSNPRGLAIDALDNLYVGDTGNNAIRKITPGGLVTTLARGFSFGCCGGMLVVDKQGNVYVADTGSNTIKRVTASGIVQTLIGSGSAGSSSGEGIQASFQAPNGVAIGPDGGLVISDTGNGTIRKTTPLPTTPAKRRAVRK